MDKEHIKILEKGVKAWNQWRADDPSIKPDLSNANLNGYDLRMGTYRLVAYLDKMQEDRRLAVSGIALKFGVDFRNVNLAGAELNESLLTHGYFNNANLKRAQFTDADLRKSIFHRANLTNTKFMGANLQHADFSQAKILRAKFQDANLRDAMLHRAEIFKTNFERAILSKANFHEASVREGNFKYTMLDRTYLGNVSITGSNLYGTVREGWQIEGIKCDYIFFDANGENRFPRDRDFKQGEFEELYEKLPTIEYAFEHGFTPIDALVMDQVVQAINEKHPGIELRLDSFHSRGRPHAVFTVLHKHAAEEAMNQIKAEYEKRIVELEAERDTLEKCFKKALEKPRTIIKRIEMGDRYDIKGQVGAVGPGAHAEHINFTQLWDQLAADIDLNKLTLELSQLKDKLKQQADEADHYRTIAEISEAESAAKKNNGSKALEHLKNAGKWAFRIAEDIGTKIAAEALKKAMGL